MKKLLLLTLLLLPFLPAKAQTFSGRSGADTFVLPPFRFCFGEDDGGQTCEIASQRNEAKLFNGTWDFRLTNRTVATLPSATVPDNLGRVYRVKDALSATDCVVGGGPGDAICYSNGLMWVPLGSSGGGGGGTVGPGTPGVMSGFVTSTTIGNSDCTFDVFHILPTRCPNGLNTANNGNYDEWIVDTGGVVANKLVCRSASSAIKVVICPAGSTNTVVGVALSTVSAGGTVIVGWAGKLQVVSSNATTQQHWLIPSVSVAGDVDDTGSTTPPASTGIFTVPAENSVGAGQSVQITLFALDTFQQAANPGVIIPCSQDGVAYYSAAGTSNSINCIPSPTSPGLYPLVWNVPSTSAVVPAPARAGAAGRIISGTTDTIVVRDRDPKILYYTSATGAAITIPDVGAAGFDQAPVIRVVAANTTGGPQNFTFTRQTSSTITVVNGFTVTTGTSFTLTTGQFATLSTSDNANWTATINGGGSGYSTIDNAGSALPQRNIVNFTGSGVSCVDNAGVPRTDCTIAGPIKTCDIVIGAENGTALGNSDIGPQDWQCRVDKAGTIIEVAVIADASTPSALPRKTHLGSNTNLLSGALSTAALGAVACSNTGGTLSIDGSTTCTNTLTTTAIAAGDFLGIASGVAGGTAKMITIHITWTVP